jgi:hypothetical protein
MTPTTQPDPYNRPIPMFALIATADLTRSLSLIATAVTGGARGATPTYVALPGQPEPPDSPLQVLQSDPRYGCVDRTGRADGGDRND